MLFHSGPQWLNSEGPHAEINIGELDSLARPPWVGLARGQMVIVRQTKMNELK